MEWSDKGLVLSRGCFREADVWLRLLFRDHGVRTVFAFGGLHSRRRFVGCLDVLNELECRVRTRRDGRYEELLEAALTRGAGALRTSRAGLGIAVNCLRLIEGAGVPAESSRDCWRLARELLALLGSEEAPKDVLFTLFFRLKFLGLLGYAPDFGHCVGCRSPLGAEAFFCVEEGGAFCPDCRARRRGVSTFMLSRSALDTLAAVQRVWPRDWPGLALAPRDRRAAAACVDGMLFYYAGLAWERGRFVRYRTTSSN